VRGRAMKRGGSGLSLVVALNKPSGMTSHDVVNRCRRIFGERRVGHTGTLDPLATGVLPICVGPATRLASYLTAHDKRYRTTIGFGYETDTDDIEGAATNRGEPTGDMLDGSFADAYIAGLVGKHSQVPPRYSAIKQGGKKAYELARAGADVQLEPRVVEVYESCLIDRYETEAGIRWVVDFSVSKGTYIRALARDIGRELGCYAHVVALERRQAGALGLQDCVSLETLQDLGEQAALDPVRLLGYRIVFADECEKAVANGNVMNAEKVSLYEIDEGRAAAGCCGCTGSVFASAEEPREGERFSVVVANKLKGIYVYDARRRAIKPECVFSTGVSRG